MLDSDRDAILEIQASWLAREARRDIPGLMDLCTDDVVWMPPQGPRLQGRADIQQWLHDQPVTTVDVTLENVQVDADGRIAYKLADFRTKSTNPGSGETAITTGSHLWVLRKSTDGSWKLAGLSWSVLE